MRPLNVLIGCERSGIVRDAFIRAGHNAVSCDLLPSLSSFGPHIQGDIVSILGEKRDLFIAHPECTFLCNSGVRWLLTQPGRFIKMVKAAKFFVKCLNANATHKAVENPVPHGYAMVIIKQKYSQIIQPWQFGHGETKATCLWLCNLPLLQPSNVVAGRSARIHKMSPGPDRGWLRSVTYTGIAQAMADQWGAFISRSRA